MILIYVTHPDKVTADSIVTTLLQERLIACGALHPIESSYWWKGVIENSQEIVSLLKTREDLWEVVRDRIIELHPYETPCIIKTDVVANDDYEAWIQTETRQKV